MIDELMKAANAIETAGITQKDWHPKLKVIPKVTKQAPCLRIWLGTDGHIKDIEFMDTKIAADLRKYEPDNGRSLPGMNLRPLYRFLVKKEEKEKLEEIGKYLDDAQKDANTDWEVFLEKHGFQDFWSETINGLGKIFGTVRQQLNDACASSLNPDETLSVFLSAVRVFENNERQFQVEYKTKLLEKFSSTPEFRPLVFMLTDNEKGDKKISVFLDVVDYKNYPIAHKETITRLNELLLNSPKDAIATNLTLSSEIDAYGGDVANIGEKFPEVSLPGLGGVKLRSQVKEVPAQIRYGFCEAQTFGIGDESRKRTKRALEWLSKPERDGHTYGRSDDKEIIFAYPVELPKDSIPQLTMMLGAQRDDVLAEQKFTKLSESVIRHLKGLGGTARNDLIEIFSLRKMDKARTKVVYYRNTSITMLETASREWQDGCKNIPSLDIKDWSAKDEKTKKAKPEHVFSEIIFPLKIYRYLNTVWKQTGEQAGTTKIFTPTDGLCLLLDTGAQSLPTNMLGRFNQNAIGYFLNLCYCKGRDEVSKVTNKNFYPSILGLLLYKLGHKKDFYMNETAFLLGRFLRVADELHKLYCVNVRKNDLPPELCGSSLLVAMQENPVMTLAQLCQRSAPYTKWAKSYQNKENAGLVHYWLNIWGDIAVQLHNVDKPQRLDHAQRAEVFLGYLASFPKKNENDDTDSTDEKAASEFQN